MKDLFRFFGPGTQLFFLVFIIGISFFLMMFTSFLVIRPIWHINIFEGMEDILKMKDEASIQVLKVIQVFNHLGMFLIPALIFSKIFGNPYKPFFTFRQKQEILVWLLCTGFFIVALPLVNYLHYLNLQVPFSESVVKEDAGSTELITKLLGGTGIAAVLINIFIYAIVPAIGEEFLFRGVILRQLALASKNIHLAVWVSAAFFSLIHGELTVFIPRFLMGAALGYIFVWSGSIWVSVLAHFINNLMSVILINGVINDRISSDVESIGMYEGKSVYVILSLILTSGVIYFFYKKRNDSYRMFMLDYAREEKEKLNDSDPDILE